MLGMSFKNCIKAVGCFLLTAILYGNLLVAEAADDTNPVIKATVEPHFDEGYIVLSLTNNDKTSIQVSPELWFGGDLVYHEKWHKAHWFYFVTQFEIDRNLTKNNLEAAAAWCTPKEGAVLAPIEIGSNTTQTIKYSIQNGLLQEKYSIKAHSLLVYAGKPIQGWVFNKTNDKWFEKFDDHYSDYFNYIIL